MKKLKKAFRVIGVLLLLSLISLALFLINKEAPITQGEINYQLTYKENRALDMYEPTRDLLEKRPVLVYFHGGAWISGAKEAINNNRYHGAIKRLREKGYVIISPQYTLAEKDKSPFPDCIIDALDVMKWIENHAIEYRLDLQNVGIMGESAGAHVAMMAAYANKGQFAPRYSFSLKYIVDVYGPSDLRALYQNSPIRKSVQAHLEKLPASFQDNLDIALYLFGFNPEVDSSKAEAFALMHSPFNYLNKDAPPILMIHGQEDRVVPINQSLDLKGKLDSLGIPNELHILPNMDHGFVGASSAQKDSTQDWVADFVERYYETIE